MPYPYMFQNPQMDYSHQSMGQNAYGNHNQYGDMNSYGSQYGNQMGGQNSFQMNNPQGMNPQPMDINPPLYPNMRLPQISPPSPFPNSNMQQARYAHGGSIQGHTPHGLAQALQSRGQRGDSILAHINPEEAEYLQENEGGDINPYTGLPQYGLFSGIGKAFKKLRKSKFFKTALPIAGGLIGTALGGPVGGAIGGGLGGGISGKNPLKSGLMGAAAGYGFGKLAPGLGNAMGVSKSGMVGKMMGMNPTYGSAGTGFGSLFGGGSKGGGGALNKLMVGAGKGSSSGGGGFLSNLLGGGAAGGKGGAGILGGLFGSGGLSGNVLPLTMLAGTMFGKQKKVKQPKEKGMQDQLAAAGIAPRDTRPLAAPQPYAVTRNPHAPQWDPLANAYLGQQDLYQEPNAARYYAHGGHLDGDTDGQADKIDAKLSDGEFVIRADVVSDLGDGNNKSGAKKLYEFMENISRHKRSKRTGLPPKAKSIHSYMKGGKRHAV